jgi:hypothetical protein
VRRKASHDLVAGYTVERGLEGIRRVASEDQPVWSVGHEKELDFQLANMRHRENEAVYCGQILAPDPDLQQRADVQYAHERKVAAQATKKAHRQQAQLQRDSWDVATCRGCFFHVEHDLHLP